MVTVTNSLNAPQKEKLAYALVLLNHQLSHGKINLDVMKEIYHLAFDIGIPLEYESCLHDVRRGIKR